MPLAAAELVAPEKTPPLRAGVGSAIVFHLHLERLSATRAVEPEAQALGERPVLAAGEVAAELGVTVVDDPLAIEGLAGQGDTVVAAARVEVEDEVQIAVAVEILDVARRATLSIAVDLALGAVADALVIHGPRVEDRGTEDRQRDDAVAQLARRGLGDVDQHRCLHAEQTLARPLPGQRERIVWRHDDRFQREISLFLELNRGSLEVVEQVRIERVRVVDVENGLGTKPQLHAVGAGQPEDHRLVPFVLQIRERGDRERLLLRARQEDQGSRDGHVVEIYGRGARDDGVVHRHLLRIVIAQRAAETNAHRRDAPFGDAEARDREPHRERPHARRAEERDLVDEVAARPAGRERTEGPAVNRRQRQAVVRRAVADVLSCEAREREAELPPAREVVRERHRPALGVIPRRSRVSIVEKVHEQRRAAAGAVEPQREPLVVRPVLWRPRSRRRVAEVVDEAGERRHVHVDLKDCVRRSDRGQHRGRRGCGRERRAARRALEGKEAKRHAVGVGAGWKAVLERVDHVIDRPHVVHDRGGSSDGEDDRPAPHLRQREAVVRSTGRLEIGRALKRRERDAHVSPPAHIVREVEIEALGGVARGIGAVVEDFRLIHEAGGGAVEPESEAVGAAPVLRSRRARRREVDAEAAEVADGERHEERAVVADLARPRQRGPLADYFNGRRDGARRRR